MFQSKLWTRAVSEVTLVAFAMSVFVPSQAHAGFHRSEIKSAVEHYTEARQHRDNGGLDAFLDAYRDDLPSRSLSFVAEHLSTSVLPSVAVVNAEFHVTSADSKQLVKIKPINLDTGEFRINGINFIWNQQESFEANVERILPLTRAQGYSFRSIWDLMIPSVYASGTATPEAEVASEDAEEADDHTTEADADKPKVEEPKKGWSTTTKVLVALAVAVVVGLIIWYLVKRSNDKKKEEENKRKADEKAKSESASLKSDYEKAKNNVRQASDNNYKNCGADWVHLNEVYSEGDSTQERIDKLNAAHAQQQTACSGSNASSETTHN
jgi:hypothetical protein